MEYDRSPDFPSHDRKLVGEPWDDFWMLSISASGGKGRKFFDQLAHGSWKRGSVFDICQTKTGEYLAGEPCHVPNPEDRSEAVIINEFIVARDNRVEMLLFEAGQVAKARLRALA
jgi:carotenoid cleavage dioxygenase-like enzyme